MLLGQLLLHHGVIDAPALGTALSHQRSFGGRLGDVLVGLGLVEERQLVDVLGRQLGVPVAHLGDRTVPDAVLRLVPEQLLRRRHAMPLWVAPRAPGARYQLVVATSDPQDLASLDELAFSAGMPVRPVLAGRRDVSRALDRHFGAAAAPAGGVTPIELGDVSDDAMVIEDVRERWLVA